MPYSRQLVYRHRRDAGNPANFMSRHPNTRTNDKRNVVDEYVNYVCNNAVPKAMPLNDITSETKEDSVLQSLIKTIKTDRWMDPEVHDYKEKLKMNCYFTAELFCEAKESSSQAS